MARAVFACLMDDLVASVPEPIGVHSAALAMAVARLMTRGTWAEQSGARLEVPPRKRWEECASNMCRGTIHESQGASSACVGRNRSCRAFKSARALSRRCPPWPAPGTSPTCTSDQIKAPVPPGARNHVCDETRARAASFTTSAVAELECVVTSPSPTMLSRSRWEGGAGARKITFAKAGTDQLAEMGG